MQELMPVVKGIKKRVQELTSRLKASEDLADTQNVIEDSFTLPDNEQQLVAILQCIKKLRVFIITITGFQLWVSLFRIFVYVSQLMY